MTVARPMLVVDGHDACGKSTLVKLVADRLGARAVKPFANTLGDHIAWLWRTKRYAEADALARASVERVCSQAGGQPMMFDRHWATMFTVLPEPFWENWGDLPPTVICHAPTPLVMRRLAERGEEVGEAAQHDYYQDLYRGLAERCRWSLVLDTGADGIDVCVKKVLAFADGLPGGCGDDMTSTSPKLLRIERRPRPSRLAHPAPP